MSMMSKYANLPDIDTAPDIYETAESSTPPPPQVQNAEDGTSTPSRIRTRKDDTQRAGREELDPSSLLTPEKAAKKFRKAERRIVYAWPPSPDSPTSPANPVKSQPLTQRLDSLRSMVASLEAEISDPSNPQLAGEDVNAGELMRGLLDVKARLEKIGTKKEGRGRLVDIVVSDPPPSTSPPPNPTTPQRRSNVKRKGSKEEMHVSDVDRRVRDLETLLGSSSTSLDDVSPLPSPLIPTVSKLNSQLTILTQPRHIDAISRRLKLLVTDLDRMSASAAHNANPGSRKHSEAAPNGDAAPPQSALQLQEQTLSALNRLTPHLPQIPHILMRLRTLSALHSSAAAFDDTLSLLESEQSNVHRGLEELTNALANVEKSMESNDATTKKNVSSLEHRVEDVISRLKALEP